MANINERIVQLKEDTSDLRKEVQELRETLQQQNDLIVRLLIKQNDLRQIEPISAEMGLAPYSRIFPLDTVEDLESYEKEINKENKEYNVTLIRNLLRPQGLLKNLGNIISSNVVMATNVDGYYNKKRLLSYTKFMDVLFNACYDHDNYTMKQFLGDFRRALRLAKNRCHKNNCVARQKLRESSEKLKDVATKTEEIYLEEFL